MTGKVENTQPEIIESSKNIININIPIEDENNVNITKLESKNNIKKLYSHILASSHFSNISSNQTNITTKKVKKSGNNPLCFKLISNRCLLCSQ